MNNDHSAGAVSVNLPNIWISRRRLQGNNRGQWRTTEPCHLEGKQPGSSTTSTPSCHSTVRFNIHDSIVTSSQRSYQGVNPFGSTSLPFIPTTSATNPFQALFQLDLLLLFLLFPLYHLGSHLKTYRVDERKGSSRKYFAGRLVREVWKVLAASFEVGISS